MRNPIENVTLLQKQINDLQLENQILKNILERNNVSYIQEVQRLREPDKPGEYEQDQGARIVHPNQITDKMANLFYARFWGRMYTLSGMRKKPQGKPLILLNVKISGRRSVLKSICRK